VSLQRIDSHQHFTREYLPSLLFPILKRNRFDGSVVVTSVPSVEESRWLLDLAAAHEFIRGVVCWAELTDPALPTLLDEYQRHAKFRGVVVGQALPPANLYAVSELARRDLTLDLPPNLELASSVAAQFPTLRIAIDHVGRPSLMEASQPDQLTGLALYPNIFVKISGLISDAPTAWKAAQFTPWVRAALAAFGPERVMFGSDWPAYLPVGTWKEALAAFTQSIGAQTLEAREYLLGAAARRFYRLVDDA
jgi:L-fuconolactonase